MATVAVGAIAAEVFYFFVPLDFLAVPYFLPVISLLLILGDLDFDWIFSCAFGFFIGFVFLFDGLAITYSLFYIFFVLALIPGT